jgi:hypothetical protein
MKKLLAILVIMMAFSFANAQLSVKNRTQITLSNDDEISLMELGKKGFVVIKNTKSEESRKLRTWTYTLYSPDLEVVWTKSMDFEKNLYILAMNTFEGDINLVYYIDNDGVEGLIDGQKIGDLTVMKITSDGEVNKKDIEFKDKIRLYRGNFVNGAYYFDATVKKEDAIMKIDFSTLALSSNKLNLPEKTDIFDRTNDGKYMYFRVSSTKKKVVYDSFFTVDDGVVIEKTPLKRGADEEYVFMKVLKPDSTHRFMLRLTNKEILGERKRDDKIVYSYYLTNMEKEDLQTANKIDQKVSDELFKDRKIELKNKFFGTYYVIRGSGDITSSCFRYNGKNFVVFDKYQKVYSEHSSYDPNTKSTYIYYIFEAYYYTNTILWCFNDDGEIEWTKNFEYDIVSPYYHEKTCARPYKDNTIALIGHFDNELSYKTISMEGEVIEGTENQKVLNKNKFSDVKQFNNSITHLYGNTYLVWGNDDDNKSDAGGKDKEKKKSKNKKAVNMMFKIVEFE